MTPLDQLASLTLPTLLLLTLGYAVLVAVFPFKPCRRCRGGGKLRSPLGRARRYCPRCRGSGLRLRIARRLWNYLTRLHRDSQR